MNTTTTEPYVRRLRTVGIVHPEEVWTVEMKRERFLELVENTVKRVLRAGHELPEIEGLRKTAREMPRFPLARWMHEERGCGCVVGEYLVATQEISRASYVDEGGYVVNPTGEHVGVLDLLQRRPDGDAMVAFGTFIDEDVTEELRIVGVRDENGNEVSRITSGNVASVELV